MEPNLFKLTPEQSTHTNTHSYTNIPCAVFAPITTMHNCCAEMLVTHTNIACLCLHTVYVISVGMMYIHVQYVLFGGSCADKGNKGIIYDEDVTM